MDPAPLTAALKDEARRLGFDLAGACPAVTPTGVARLGEWIEAGYAGEMHYLQERQRAYEHPRHVLDGARSILMLAVNYRSVEPPPVEAGDGRISRYARGDDYHRLVRDKLHRLADFLRRQSPGAEARGVIDTAPLLEREFAQLAGLGWIGKNTLLLNKRLGSWFFLAALLTDVELAYDAPHAADHCGSCRACLDACPTDAFVDAYVLDSRKCISYLTIEHRSKIPAELRAGMDDWVFGCDICQDVCPWNHRAPRTSEAGFEPRQDQHPLALAALFDLDEAAFRDRFRHTPLWRPKRRGLLRNAAIALGNHPTRRALPALVKGLVDEEPLVRGACAWALGRFTEEQARDALRERITVEVEAEVRREIHAALESS